MTFLKVLKMSNLCHFKFRQWKRLNYCSQKICGNFKMLFYYLVCQNFTWNHFFFSIFQGLWLAATAAIVIISLCGIFGVLVIPIMQKVFYQHLIQFLVALAIGTLSGDALLHLYPHALLSDFAKNHNKHDHDEDFHSASVWKGFAGNFTKFSDLTEFLWKKDHERFHTSIHEKFVLG